MVGGATSAPLCDAIAEQLEFQRECPSRLESFRRQDDRVTFWRQVYQRRLKPNDAKAHGDVDGVGIRVDCAVVDYERNC